MTGNQRQPIRQKTLDGRYIDSADFTSEHDSAMLWLQDNWKTLIPMPDDEWRLTEGNFQGEPNLQGAFPDGIAKELVATRPSDPIPFQRLLNGYHPPSPDNPLVATEWFTCRKCVNDHPNSAYAPHHHKTGPDNPVLGPCILPIEPAIFEIKPKLTSFGEVLRQLRIYQSRLKSHCQLHLLTPDTRFDDAFLKEGIHVHHEGFHLRSD